MRSVARKTLALAVPAAIALPLLSLMVAALTDRPAGSTIRWSAIPAALVLLDPLRMESFGNSVAVATIVSLLTTIMGFGLARASWAKPFWGRPVLLVLAIVPASTMPLLGALGLRAWISGLGLESPPLRPDEGLGRWTGPPDPRWVALVWCQVAFAAPWAGRRIAGALGSVREEWVDAARGSGIGRWYAWRRLIWPLVRPSVARVASGVFVASLLEPGAPLVLGLRRTLSAQIVEGVRRDEFPRAATLSILAILVTLGVHRLFRYWGGHEGFGNHPRLERTVTDTAFVPLRPWLARLTLLAWCGLGLLPIGGLILLAGRDAASEAGLIAGFDPSIFLQTSRSALSDACLPGALGLGFGGTFLSWTLALILGQHLWSKRVLALLAAMPPLAICVGIAGLPVLGSAVGLAGTVPGWADPRAVVLMPLVYGLAMLQLPWAVAGSEQIRASVPPRLIDAAKVAGLPARSRFWRVARPLAGPATVAGLALVALQGAVGLSPGLAIGLLSEPTTLAPALLDGLRDLDGSRPFLGPALLIQLIGLATLPVMASWQSKEVPLPPRC